MAIAPDIPMPEGLGAVLTFEGGAGPMRAAATAAPTTVPLLRASREMFPVTSKLLTSVVPDRSPINASVFRVRSLMAIDAPNPTP